MNKSNILFDFIAIPLLIIFLVIQTFQLQSRNNEIDQYQTQITQLEEDYKNEVSKLAMAKQEADRELIAANAKTKNILSTPVPVDCLSAIKWAIEQSHYED